MTGGIQTHAAQLLGVTPQAIGQFIDRNNMRKDLEEAEREVGDMALSNIVREIKKGCVTTSKWWAEKRIDKFGKGSQALPKDVPAEMREKFEKKSDRPRLQVIR